jgi:hypothetical protein
MAPEICASDPRAREHTSTKSGCRHNFSKKKKKLSPGPKNGLERRPPAILYNLREKSGPKNKY